MTAGNTCATYSSVYLLYWYTSTNTDADDCGRHLRDVLLPTFVCTHTHSERARAVAMERMLQRPSASVFVRLYQFKKWYSGTSKQASCFSFYGIEMAIWNAGCNALLRQYLYVCTSSKTGTFVPVASKLLFLFFWNRNSDMQRMLQRPSASVFVRLYVCTSLLVLLYQ
jgi:hypothetical protein